MAHGGEVLQLCGRVPAYLLIGSSKITGPIFNLPFHSFREIFQGKIVGVQSHDGCQGWLRHHEEKNVILSKALRTFGGPSQTTFTDPLMNVRESKIIFIASRSKPLLSIGWKVRIWIFDESVPNELGASLFENAKWLIGTEDLVATGKDILGHFSVVKVLGFPPPQVRSELGMQAQSSII